MPMNILLRCILLFICLPSLHAQQIEFKLDVRPEIGHSATFDDRFRGPMYENYELKSTDYYRDQHVKSMSVYNSYNKLYRYWEFDTAGVITVRGRQNFYYTENIYKTVKPGEFLEVSRYFSAPGGSLVRCDSILRKYNRFTFSDTVIGWTNYRITVYKIGSLINEQNTYYNTRYYNKKVVVHDAGLGVGSTVDEEGQFEEINPGGHVFIKKPLRSDYNKDQLYKCSYFYTDEGFYASCNNGNKDLTQMQVYYHRLAKEFNRHTKKQNFTDGEWFDEPSEMEYPMECGNRRDNGPQPWLTYSKNERGLYDTCFLRYLVVDTSPEATAKYEKRRQQLNRQGGRDPDASSGQPYLETPAREARYYFRYTYYKD